MNDLMRVGGRLNLASITFEAEYQIILPKNDHVTNLVIEHYHLLSGHSGRYFCLKFGAREVFDYEYQFRRRKSTLQACWLSAPPRPSLGTENGWPPLDRLTPERPPFTSDVRWDFHVLSYPCGTHEDRTQLGNRFSFDGIKTIYREKGPS